MGPATAMIGCVICCVCILVGLIIAYFIWAIMTLVNSTSSMDTACGKHLYVWQFCLTCVVIAPILSSCVNLIVAASQSPFLAAIPMAVAVGVSIWGLVIWSQLGECDAFYSRTYPDLLLLMKIYNILAIILLSTLGCALVRKPPSISLCPRIRNFAPSRAWLALLLPTSCLPPCAF